MRNLKTGKYLYISHDKKIFFSLMHLSRCARFDIDDKIHYCLSGLMDIMHCTNKWYNNNRGWGCNNGKHPMILAAYKTLFHIIISSVKPEHIFALLFNVGLVFNVKVR